VWRGGYEAGIFVSEYFGYDVFFFKQKRAYEI